MNISLNRLHAACVLAVGIMCAGQAVAAPAQDDEAQEIELLKRQVSELTKRLDELSKKQESNASAIPATTEIPPPPPRANCAGASSRSFGAGAFAVG